MENILRPNNSVLIDDDLPMDYGIIKAREVLDSIHEEDAVFEQRTREALTRVENTDSKGMSESQFKNVLDSW